MRSLALSNRTKHGLDLTDLAVLGGLAALIFAIVMVAREWSGVLQPVAQIHSEARYLPLYALFSLTRGILAYVLSFLFTMIYGYAAARITGAERIMLPILDILQSIPVLGFLPGFVLGLVHLFPRQNLGLEMASVLMIFTGQVWNMTFSFYASLKSVPEDLVAVARLTKMSWWQRFVRVDLSYSATGLVWNSMMSMAGGWFFLTISEAFVLGEHDFRLPGVGSYMSVAIERGDMRGQVLGVLAMLGMIVLLDQVVWRPVVAWSQKFCSEETTGPEDSWVWERLRRARLWVILVRTKDSFLRRTRSAKKFKSLVSPALARRLTSIAPWSRKTFLIIAVIAIGYALVRYVRLLHDLSASEWLIILLSTLMTFIRVLAAVALSSLWTIPAGVWIGRNPRWSRRLQPFIQITASFPMPMIYPLVLGLVLSLGAGLGIGSVFLLLLGTQWYILFNVIAGATAIPRELWEVTRLTRMTLRHRWQKLILPAIFPALLTGWITAMGGAWNASIVAEYIKFKGATLTTVGLGALISQATDKGHFAMLGAAVGIMSVSVVLFNRFVWHPLSALAQNRFNLGA